MRPAELYDRDFYEWTQRNAELLRSGRAGEADLSHIAEEIEDMGKALKHALQSRLTRLIMHLLKLQFQPAMRTRSWLVTIANQRIGINSLLEENPSFRADLSGTVAKAYPNAVRLAATETGIARETFPPACPFSVDQLLNEDYLPG